MRRLVILRPEPGASATAMEAAKLGLETITMSLFAVEPVDWRAPDGSDFDAVVLTSANAVRHGGAQLDRFRELPAHCVGEATATAADQRGFTVASVGSGGVEALLDLLPPETRMLHLCGADRREPQALKQRITAVPVYRAVELPAPEALRQIEGMVVAVHSPRAAGRLSQLAQETGVSRETTMIAAISDEAAAAAGAGWRAVESADGPGDAELLALAARLCKNQG